MSSAVKPFVESSALLGDGEAVRARVRRDGYLFLRGLIPRDDLLALRRDILGVCRAHGFLAADAPLEEGIAAPGVKYIEPDTPYQAAYRDLQRLESFHAMAHHPALLAVMEQVTGEAVLVHPRNIGRLMFPNNNQHTTPAHQDYIHIQGTEETYTAWIPLGDCPRALGGLEALAGSHRFGVLPGRQAYGAGGVGVDTDHLGLEWHGGDFACGDVLLFHSLCVHRATPNLTPDRMRLSLDYRYQGVSQPVTQGSLEPHMGCLSWDEIYAGWRETRLQYYWRSLPLNIVPFTTKYHEAILKA